MWNDRKSYNPKITIVTALFDGRCTGIPHSVGIYNEEWVNRLYRGISRNYNDLFDFICLVDKNYKFKEDIKGIRFKRSVDQYGWMSLMEMYHPDLCTGKRFTVGLDTIITGPLDDIFEYDAKIAVCTDPLTPQTICNAVTICNDEFCEEFWNSWVNDEYNKLQNNKLDVGGKQAPSEMVLLRNLYGDSPRIDTIFKSRILSYKAHIQHKPERIKDSSIIYFHGYPKPHEIVNQQWVMENWK
jgi:hypothetical protein|tara:strand:- start:2940 stop:3662 length:723 start_codon:yes stop_codon:yes gene_type:complete